MIKYLLIPSHIKCFWNTKREIPYEIWQEEQILISFKDFFVKA